MGMPHLGRQLTDVQEMKQATPLKARESLRFAWRVLNNTNTKSLTVSGTL